MSFGQQDDEFFTIELKELLANKQKILKHDFIPEIVPVMTNYQLKAGFVFQLAVVPFAVDVTVGELYDSDQPNDYQLCDHLEINTVSVSGDEHLSFIFSDYKRIRNVLDGNLF